MTSTTAPADLGSETEGDFSVRKALRSPRRLRTEVLAGLVVAFTMAVTIAVVGGRPAMISAAN